MPVGFKHVSAAMVEHDALLGGESSGGLTIRGHILGKDGIFAAALIVEMLAVTGKRVSQLLSQIYEMTGYMKMVEVNLPATSEMRIVIPKQVEALIEGHQTKPLQLGPYAVQRVSQMDGVKFYLEDDAWVLLRFSGTEPILRIFAEAESEDKAQALIDALLELLGLDREF